MRNTVITRATLIALVGSICFATQASADAQKIEIPPGELMAALASLARQSSVEIVYLDRDVKGIHTKGVSGTLSAKEAVTKLLEGTPLIVRTDSSGAILIAPPAPKSVELEEVTVRGIPEILVLGKRSMNTDIERTEDDMQPYVVFDADELARSMATTPEEFLKTRLPMNTLQSSNSQVVAGGTTSQINLRGLGTNQTLILVDGRRMPAVSSSGDARQPDINGIPMSSIERIEVLPATASGIYGGGATGGVVNIITRKDYSGVEVRSTYGDTFQGDARNYRLDVSSGFSLEDGRTRITMSGSLADSDPLFERDTDIVERYRRLQLANNPSAFYTFGTAVFPPFGYTTNIRSQNGTNLVLDNGTPLNSPFTHVPVGYAGPASDNGAALFGNAGRYNLDIPDDLNGMRRSLLTATRVTSALVNVRREFSPSVEGFLDLGRFDNDGQAFYAVPPTTVTLQANAANNPFNTAINVRFPATGLVFPFDSSVETLRATGGAIVRLGGDWTAAADYSWARVRNATSQTNPVVGDPDGPTGPGASVTAALQDGRLNVMRDLNAFPLDWSPYLFPSPNLQSRYDNTLNDATLRLSGPLFEIPGGSVRLSSAVEWREESIDGTLTERFNADGTVSLLNIPGRVQSVTSYYLESLVPLISRGNSLPFVHELELQGSVRHDAYRTRSPSPAESLVPRGTAFPEFRYVANEVSATKYTFGVRYAPVADVTLRASFGTGFLPPSISQISPNLPGLGQTLTLIDPKRGGVSASVGPYDRFGGGSADLLPEDSESLSFGVIFTPYFVPGLRLSLDYTRIEKLNEIRSLSDQEILNLEHLFPDRVRRDPLSASDAALGYTGGVIRSIDRSIVNVASTHLEAYDLQLDQTIDTQGLGRFRFYAVATWQPELERQTLPGTPFVDVAGFRFGVLEWRANAGLTWDRGPWTAGWSAQYFDSYYVYEANAAAGVIATAVLSQGSAKVAGETYHDAFVRYRFSNSHSQPWRGLEMTLGIQNVLDKHPGVKASTGASASQEGGLYYGDPRLRRYSLTLQKSF